MAGFLQNLFSGKRNGKTRYDTVEKDSANKERTETAEKTANDDRNALRPQTPNDMARTVNKIAFRASKSNQSESYYKPTQEEALAAQRVTQAAMNALKAQHIDRRSVRAKEAYVKAVAAYARTPEGQKDLAVLQKADEKAALFEKNNTQTKQARTVRTENVSDKTPAPKEAAPETVKTEKTEAASAEENTTEKAAEQIIQPSQGQTAQKPKLNDVLSKGQEA